MPVRKRPGKNCYKVTGVKTEKCLTKEQAQKQNAAIQISKQRRRKRNKG